MSHLIAMPVSSSVVGFGVLNVMLSARALPLVSLPMRAKMAEISRKAPIIVYDKTNRLSWEEKQLPAISGEN